MVESSQDSSNDQSVPTISQLIADQMDATGRSYRELAKASGDRVKYQTFQELRTAPPKSWPKSVETIRGMAAALDVSETAVVLGYACSLGVDVRADSMLAQQLPSSSDRLAPAERNAIVGLIRAITSKGNDHGASTEEEQEPRAEAGGKVDGGTAGGDRGWSGAPIAEARKIAEANDARVTAEANDAAVTRRVKVTRLQRKNQAESLSGDDMPPPDYSSQLAARSDRKH